jgi:phage N-6-adenine-methyltransferase
MTSAVLYSSKSDLYPTPRDFFDRVNRRFGPLTTDVCALPENAKCPRFFTPEDDGLKQEWAGRCWMNPPYGKTIGLWLAKAVESAINGASVVCLLPARVDTRWWHNYVEPFAQLVEFPKGRLRFGDGKYPAPFPSALVVFGPTKLLVCEHCGKNFVPRRADARYCSGACRQAAYRARFVTDRAVTDAAGGHPAYRLPRGAQVHLPDARTSECDSTLPQVHCQMAL